LLFLTDVTQHITVRCTSTGDLSIFTTNILVRCTCFAEQRFLSRKTKLVEVIFGVTG